MRTPTRGSRRDSDRRSPRPGARRPLQTAIGIAGVLAAWGALTLLAIKFARSAAAGQAMGWIFMAVAGIGAVACLYLALMLIIRVATGASSTAVPEVEQQVEDPPSAAGRDPEPVDPAPAAQPIIDPVGSIPPPPPPTDEPRVAPAAAGHNELAARMAALAAAAETQDLPRLDPAAHPAASQSPDVTMQPALGRVDQTPAAPGLAEDLEDIEPVSMPVRPDRLALDGAAAPAAPPAATPAARTPTAPPPAPAPTAAPPPAAAPAAAPPAAAPSPQRPPMREPAYAGPPPATQEDAHSARSSLTPDLLGPDVARPDWVEVEPVRSGKHSGMAVDDSPEPPPGRPVGGRRARR